MGQRQRNRQTDFWPRNFAFSVLFFCLTVYVSVHVVCMCVCVLALQASTIVLVSWGGNKQCFLTLL